VAGVFVEEHRHRPAPVVVSDVPQERLEVAGPLPLAGQQQAVAGPQAQGPEDHSPGVPAADRDRQRPAPPTPAGPQRREQE
jgi:hypothetical protein